MCFIYWLVAVWHLLDHLSVGSRLGRGEPVAIAVGIVVVIIGFTLYKRLSPQ